MIKLFPFRPIVLFISISILSCDANAQLIDGILGQKRTLVQLLLRPYRIVDYRKERVVYSIEKGIHQTVFYENDTCRQFYWAVAEDRLNPFRAGLLDNGYRAPTDVSYAKDSLKLTVRPLKSGRATLFIASLSEDLTGRRDPSGRHVRDRKQKKREADPGEMPLLQQAILAEDKDPASEKPKDPQRNWIGGRYGKVSVLGWE